MENMPMYTYLFILIIIISPYILKYRLPLNSIINTVVSLGILGTFIGVFLGLLHFDVKNISESVPELLDGLKTAFVTSIFGIIISLIVKTFPSVYGIKVEKVDATKEEASVKTMIKLLENIENSIAGDNETTLITQIQKLRTTNTDKLDELNKSFNDFAEKVVADSTQSLIDALTQVMKDFNAQINEQFGENFKHLNDGVGKMLEWQKEYASRIEVMTEQFNNSLKGIKEIEKVLTDINQKATSYHETSVKLQEILDNLNTNLAGIDEMAKRSKDIFPIIQEQINNLTTDFSSAVKSAIRENNKILETQKNAIDNQINSMAISNERLANQHTELINKLNERINNLMKENANRITEQLTNLDEELSNELNKALSSLGSQLTSLSNKFVKDYTPLTDELRRIIQIANLNKN